MVLIVVAYSWLVTIKTSNSYFHTISYWIAKAEILPLERQRTYKNTWDTNTWVAAYRVEYLLAIFLGKQCNFYSEYQEVSGLAQLFLFL